MPSLPDKRSGPLRRNPARPSMQHFPALCRLRLMAERKGGDSSPRDPEALLHDDLMAEYFKIADVVSQFDQRLLTIKGWGVTLSLASLGLGFQQDHYGLFLVAAVSALAFWIVEGSTKLHQMRYYPRMGDIEVSAYEMYGVDHSSGRLSSQLIDWAWHTARPRVRGGEERDPPQKPRRWPEVNPTPGRHPLLLPHTVFPHLVTAVVGTVFFILGLAGALGPI